MLLPNTLCWFLFRVRFYLRPARFWILTPDISLPFLLVRNANSLVSNSCKCGEKTQKTGVLLL